jgi:hypothetical protein|tara:strand:+ start:4321 stop:4833 length:513 start_codon:yes stop_codon:yes gene_type:complete
MKKLIKDFKKFLTEAQKSDYESGGELTLYHYAPVDSDQIIVDPKYFADRAKRSTFSMREYETSTVPRTFWYVDVMQRESQVATGRNLYQATIPASDIYDFRNDPEGHQEMHRHPVYGLRKGEEWNEMLEHIRESYAGIYYSLSNFDVVSLFVPYEATRVSPERQAQLEGA